jgi:hypothetical protein
LYRYEYEVIDNVVDEIDYVLSGIGKNLDSGFTSLGPIQTLTMVGVGSTATATITSIVNGGIRFITVTNRGGGYTGIPRIGISSAPSGGTTGIATAVMIGGVVACNDNINPSAKSVQEVRILNPGFGYTTAPGVRFINGGGSGAAATATIGNGIIGTITVTNAGSGYTAAPSITFAGVSSVSAAATAIVNDAGNITSIQITNSGLGYTQAPTVAISSPFTSGIGTYQFNEVIVGSISGTTARVRSWNAITNKLEIATVDGEFVAGETIVGSASSASYKVRLINTDVVDDGYADNTDIETEADKIIDFSEFNPFGMP